MKKITVLQILSKIVDNHCRLPDFIFKLEQIFQYLLRAIQISKYNKLNLIIGKFVNNIVH